MEDGNQSSRDLTRLAEDCEALIEESETGEMLVSEIAEEVGEGLRIVLRACQEADHLMVTQEGENKAWKVGVCE